MTTVKRAPTDTLSKDIEQAINYTLPSIKNVAIRLRNDLTTDDYRFFLANLSVEAETIWYLLKHAFLRGDFKFTSESTPSDDTSNDPEHLETALSDGPNGAPHQEVIPLVGPRSIIFEWGDAPAHKTGELKGFAQRCVLAIAHRHTADINQIINFMLNGQDYETGLTRLRDQVRDEQKKHNRLIVKGQVSNTGGSPFSIMTRGKTFILTRGYPYSREVDNNNSVSNQRTYQEDMQIDVELMKEGEDQQDDSPISVNAGGIQRFTAVSLTRIDVLSDPEVLLSVFGAGERRFYLGILSITPGSEPLTPLYTAPQLFRNWRTESEIPPLSGWLRRVFGRILGRFYAESLPQGGMAPR
jgi:hypothetical protein